MTLDDNNTLDADSGIQTDEIDDLAVTTAKIAALAVTNAKLAGSIDLSKLLTPPEANSTADQTGAEIKTAYELEADTNAYDDNAVTKLGLIEGSATADQTDAEIKTAYENNANTNEFSDANVTTLGNRAPLASPTFTGTVVLPNVPVIVTTELDLKSPIASPTFTGTIAIPNYADVETTLGTIEVNRAPLASPTFTGTVVLPITSLTDDLTITDAKNIVINTTTGTKIGTAASQKIGLWGATPVIQQSHVADPSADVGSLKTAVDAILAQLATVGIQASA